jgi:predicted small metal-binding protein
MHEMECTPGMNKPFDATGPIKSELIKKCFDLAQPEHKMYTLTADIVYKIQITIKE